MCNDSSIGKKNKMERNDGIGMAPHGPASSLPPLLAIMTDRRGQCIDV